MSEDEETDAELCHVLLGVSDSTEANDLLRFFLPVLLPPLLAIPISSPSPQTFNRFQSYILSSRISTRMTLRRPLGVLQLKTNFPRPPGDVVRAPSCAAFPFFALMLLLLLDLPVEPFQLGWDPD